MFSCLSTHCFYSPIECAFCPKFLVDKRNFLGFLFRQPDIEIFDIKYTGFQKPKNVPNNEYNPMRIQSDGHQASSLPSRDFPNFIIRLSNALIRFSNVFIFQIFLILQGSIWEVPDRCIAVRARRFGAGGCRLKGAGAFRRHRACYRSAAVSFWAASSAASCSATPCSILERLADLASW